jgi:hypothetical protein
MVQSKPGQIVHETLSQKYPSPKRATGVAQGVGPEFKPQYGKKTNKKLTTTTTKTVLKRSTNGQQIHEEMFKILCHKGNVNQNSTEIPPQPRWLGLGEGEGTLIHCWEHK